MRDVWSLMTSRAIIEECEGRCSMRYCEADLYVCGLGQTSPVCVKCGCCHRGGYQEGMRRDIVQCATLGAQLQPWNTIKPADIQARLFLQEPTAAVKLCWKQSVSCWTVKPALVLDLMSPGRNIRITGQIQQDSPE
jgi:hypothetical protein